MAGGRGSQGNNEEKLKTVFLDDLGSGVCKGEG